ncbi:hypothetical protein EDB80DRAFT_757192 [Ilyonectria destructans]|nr:hypothetical protein EDB80DRAFT_757192 [Ilyonectria destructans]
MAIWRPGPPRLLVSCLLWPFLYASSLPPQYLFCKLLTELRLKIWNFNLPRTRLVSIRCCSSSPSLLDSSRESLSWTSGCTSTAPIPINLHVCAESRAEALGHYQLEFGFGRGQGQLATVRRIAVNDALFWIDNSYRSITAASLTVEVLRRIQTRMPRLQEIIVPRDEESMDGPGTVYLEPTMVHVRMARQIQATIATLCQQTPHWKPPR